MPVRSAVMTRALIVEDDPRFALLLRDILSEDVGIDEVVSAATLTQARRLLEHSYFRLTLLDLGLPDGSGAELLGELPDETCAIIVTVFGDEDAVTRAMAAGADGYLLKDDATIGASIRSAMDGQTPLSAAVATHLIRSWRRLTGSEPLHSNEPCDVSLSPRETEILQSFAEGLSYNDTARELGISAHTVADHVKNIYRKLTVNSRASAVSKALRAGLVRL